MKSVFSIIVSVIWMFVSGLPAVSSEADLRKLCHCMSTGFSNGFSAMIMVTDDQDWQEKWGTPPETIPNFSIAKKLEQGARGNLLTFFANPLLRDGKANISCTLRIGRPGQELQDYGAFLCVDGEITGDIRNVRMTGLNVELVVEEDDPTGIWTIEVDIRDNFRGAMIPLTTSVEFVGGVNEQ